MEKIADGLFKLGSHWVNFYLIEADGAVTIVDGGLPSYIDQVHAALRELGRQPSDVKAVVLTHSHTDHLGVLPAVMEMTGAPVLAPKIEADIVTGDRKPVPPKGVLRSTWRLNMWKFMAHGATNKGLANITVPDVTPYGGDEILDVPGKLRTIATPGHSAGHTSVLLEDRRTLICGDAIATLAVDSGRTGPMIHPFNEDRAQAVRSLDALAPIDADVLLPGHGAPWTGRISDAVAEARRPG